MIEIPNPVTSCCLNLRCHTKDADGNTISPELSMRFGLFWRCPNCGTTYGGDATSECSAETARAEFRRLATPKGGKP